MSDLAIFGGDPSVKADASPWPSLGQDEQEGVQRVLDSGQLAGMDGQELRALCEEWALYQGCEYVLATNGGTSAILAALVSLGIGPGDQVIMPAFSFSGTFQPVLMLGAECVFVDIERDTFNMNAALVEEAITDKTRTLLPVHIHGLSCDMDSLLALARKYALTLVEDACQAHGSEYKKQKVGTFGNLGCFSLNATKNLPAGEGGLVCTNDERLFLRAASFHVFGEEWETITSPIRAYECLDRGLNLAFQELPAAIARAQLIKLDRHNRAGRSNAALLKQELSGLVGILLPIVPADRGHNYHKYRVRFQIDGCPISSQQRDALLESLRAEGVPATLWHKRPMPLFPVFRGRWQQEDFPVAVEILDSSIVLFSEHVHIAVQSSEYVHQVASAVKKVWSQRGSLWE